MKINYFLFLLFISSLINIDVLSQVAAPPSPVPPPSVQNAPAPATPAPTPVVSAAPVAAPTQANAPAVAAAPQVTSAPVAAPTAAPAPAPVVPVVTDKAQPSTPASSAPVVAPAAVPATAQPVAASNDKDFEEINKNLTETVAIKKALKDIARDVNDKLLDARKKVLSAQRLSFDVLQKTQAEAEPLVAQASAELQTLQALQNMVQNDLVPKFESNVKQVEQLIKKIQDKMNELQSKGLKFQISQSQSQAQQPTQPGQPSAVTPQPTSPSTASSGAATTQTQSPTFYSRTWDWVTENVASTASFVKKTWKGFKNWAFKKEPDELKKNFKPVEALKYQAPESEAKVAGSFDAVKNYLGLCENAVKGIDTQFNQIYQKYLELRLKISLIEASLQSNIEFRSYIESYEMLDPWWKRYIVQNISDALDVLIVFYAATKKVVWGIYNYFFVGLWSKFVSDVQAKMKSEEQSKLPEVGEKKLTEEKVSNNVPSMPIIPTK